MQFAPRIVKWGFVALCAAPLCACSFLDSFVPKKGSTTDVVDRTKNLTIQDFRDLNNIEALTKKANEEQPTSITAALGAPPIPELAQVLEAPRPPKVGNTKLVTLAVTDDVPLRDVLFELGRLAGVDIEVGAGLDTAGINLRATDRPFNEVIDRISTLAGLRYSVNGKSIRVERDLPYLKNYSLDFLNIVRSSNSSYNVTTSILGGGGSGGSSGGSSSGSSGGSSGGSSKSGSGSGTSSAGTVGNSGTSSAITTQGESDLWSALESSLNEIVAYNPSGAATAVAGGASAGGAAGPSSAGAIVINRQSGVLSANATQAQHEMIARFLSMMSRNSSAQVLIEAKIVEVSLLDQFLSGVNWNSLLGNAAGVQLGLGNYYRSTLDSGGPTLGSIATGPSTATSTAGAGASPLALSVDGGDIEAILKATQRFGTTRTLSSPRLSAINNQQAILTFARNEVFVDCDITAGASTSTTGSTSTSTAPTVSCNSSSVPIGVILNILPSINLDSQEVTLNVRPTLTRIVGTVENPGVAISAKAVGLTLEGVYPIVEVRELDSIMKVKSGGVMVIGGLMEDVARNSSDGVPGLGEVPIFGNLFKSRSEDTSKRELVIFIKATIVNSDGSADRIDRAVYDKYVTDPRPLFPN